MLDSQCLICNLHTWCPISVMNPSSIYTTHNFWCGSCHTRVQRTLNHFSYALPSRRNNADTSAKTNISISFLRHDHPAMFLILSAIYTLIPYYILVKYVQYITNIMCIQGAITSLNKNLYSGIRSCIFHCQSRH